ncbi:hypothetical protein EJ08DRAFT_289308 [Tothia fuscella]|uniref:Restriction of telomere capping protein 4 n=1 Tax=Tothia fuscella TaxID=1048955 RepID=A0A9P4U3N2_9PEZI|nr:hypothetical protein EJ08DRAFT_289308 [Tothia fuscella]
MPHLGRDAPRLLTKVKDQEWATSEDHEDPIGRPPESSDDDDANARADIRPTKIISSNRSSQSSPKRKLGLQNVGSRKSSRTAGKGKGIGQENADLNGKGSRPGIKMPQPLKHPDMFDEFSVRKAKKPVNKYTKNVHVPPPLPVKPESKRKDGGFRLPAEFDTSSVRSKRNEYRAAAPPNKLDADALAGNTSGEESDFTSSAMSERSSRNKRAIRPPTEKLRDPPKEPRPGIRTAPRIVQASLSSTPTADMEAAHLSDKDDDADDADWHAKVDPICPNCRQKIDLDFLLNFLDDYKKTDAKERTYPTVREQQSFCQKHRQSEARKAWTEQGYPDLDMKNLPTRLEKYNSNIKRLLENPHDSHFRRHMEERVKEGSARTLRHQVQNSGLDDVSVGYYGTMGLELIMYHLITEFSETIRCLSRSDKIMAARGSSEYVQLVLAPELATLLIMEDMSVDGEEARKIMRESTELGDVLCGKDESEQTRRKRDIANTDVDDYGDTSIDDFARTQMVY